MLSTLEKRARAATVVLMIEGERFRLREQGVVHAVRGRMNKMRSQLVAHENQTDQWLCNALVIRPRTTAVA